MAPWLTRDACRWLEEWLCPSHVGVEWGSGRSTLWFAERVGRLTSIEHVPSWHARVKSQLENRGVRNVDYHLALLEAIGDHGAARYVEIGARGPTESLDFALVDGTLRDLCTQAAMRRLRPGGLLVIDNAERYIPHGSHSPSALHPTKAGASALWSELNGTLASWPCTWTSNGIWDTALFTKPA
jgi:predicted O-methyltransferase YrrM